MEIGLCLDPTSHLFSRSLAIQKLCFVSRVPRPLSQPDSSLPPDLPPDSLILRPVLCHVKASITWALTVTTGETGLEVLFSESQVNELNVYHFFKPGKYTWYKIKKDKSKQ